MARAKDKIQKKRFLKKQKRKKKSRKNEGGKRHQTNNAKLSRILSDPAVLDEYIHRIKLLLIRYPDFRNLRFEKNAHLENLIKPFNTSRADMELTGLFKLLVTPEFVTKCDGILRNCLSSKNFLSEPEVDDLKTALFFLEAHRKLRVNPDGNPLWHAVLLATLADMRIAESSKNVIEPGIVYLSEKPIKETIHPVDITQEFLSDISEQNRNIITEAFQALQKADFILHFSPSVILSGILAVHCTDDISEAEAIRRLKTSYQKEFKNTFKEELVELLDLAMDSPVDYYEQAFRKILLGVSLFSVRENPVIFAIYHYSVMHYKNNIAPDEQPWISSIIKSGGSAGSIFDYAKFLFDRQWKSHAITVFEAALSVDPRFAAAELGLGLALWKQGSGREARLHWRRAANFFTQEAMISLCMELLELPLDAELPEHAESALINADDKNH